MTRQGERQSSREEDILLGRVSQAEKEATREAGWMEERVAGMGEWKAGRQE